MKIKKYMILTFIIIFIPKLIFEISEISTSLFSFEMILSILSAIFYGCIAMILVGICLILIKK